MKRQPLNYLRELALNGHEGMLSFLLQRVTGLGLVGYLVLHLFSLSTILGGGKKFEETLSAYDSPLFHVAEWLLLAAVVFHLFNGLRIVAVDWLGLTRHQGGLFWVSMGLSVVVVLGSIPFFFMWR